MARDVSRQEVLQLMERRARLIDVLPEAEYQHAHLPGALSMPLEQLETRAPTELRAEDTIVLYCYDAQ